jgi:DNA-binding NtrC family response regulator
MANILVIDDQDRYVTLCRKAIPEHEYIGPARCWKDAVTLLKEWRKTLDLVLLDVHFDLPPDQLIGLPPDADERTLQRTRRRQGLEILARLRRHLPDLPVILMTARADLPIERAAEALDVEDYTYFLDDDMVDARSLRAQIANILNARRGSEAEGPIFWGRTPKVRRIRARLLVLCRGRLPIILGGPTGTGKSLIARHFIHPRSERKGKFVTVDLSTLPKDLMAAHLFGSVRGAYTGSVTDKRGAFEEAEGGTLFLDEIGNLTEDAQKMLLSVLQEGSVTRIGDTQERKVDVKLVVATHENLGEMVRAKRFRADLYMRLNPACTVILPSLRERSGDLIRLLSWTAAKVMEGASLKTLLKEYRRRVGLSEEGEILVVTGTDIPPQATGILKILFPARAVRLLLKHRWGGNLREFAMVVENALTFTLAELAGLPPVGRVDLIQVRPKVVRDLLKAVQPEEDRLKEGWSCEIVIKPDPTLNHLAQEIERQYFQKLWEQEEGDFSAMARILMGDSTMGRKVQLRFNQLGLKVRDLKST